MELKWIVGVPAAIVAVIALLAIAPAPKIVRIHTEVSDGQSSLSMPDKDGRVVYNQPSSTGLSEKDKWDNAASECWKTYEKRSKTPMDKAQIASFCEGLEKRAAESR